MGYNSDINTRSGRADSLLLKTLLPVVIGLAVVAWLFVREFDPDDWHRIPWTAHTVCAIVLAWVAMAGREAGLAWRFRVLTDRVLSPRSALKVTMLCEFTSAITPTTAGGSAMSMVFLNREGISMGRGTTLMLCTLLLDEAFFVVFVPLMFLVVPSGEMFGFDGGVSAGIRIAFWCVYGGIVAVTSLLFAGIFLMPRKVSCLLLAVFGIRWLRRWRKAARRAALDMVRASADIARRPVRWWMEASAATILSWVSRYLVVNALFLAFAPAAPQLVVFARQFVIWTLLTVSPTPGGSGVSEWLFTTYYGDLINDASMALVIAICWRIITYYIYLAVGALIVPRWVRKSFHKKK